jgi:hypothetical protein
VRRPWRRVRDRLPHRRPAMRALAAAADLHEGRGARWER